MASKVKPSVPDPEKKRKVIIVRAIPLATLLILLSAAALANVPDINHSTVEWAYSGNQPLSLFVLPDGSGNALTEAFLPGGQTTDATITLTLVDDFLNPVANFPPEDLWLESTDGGMVFCNGGTVADTETDLNGRALWYTPLRAGSWSTARMNVRIMGDWAPMEGLRLSFNSADLDGNLSVNLTDVGIFATDLGAGYQYRSDFNFDGVINLVDVGLLAGGVGAVCP